MRIYFHSHLSVRSLKGSLRDRRAVSYIANQTGMPISLRTTINLTPPAPQPVSLIR